MAEKKLVIDYEAAYKDLNRRIKIMSRVSASLCRISRSTAPFAGTFDEMYDLGDCVLKEHVKD